VRKKKASFRERRKALIERTCIRHTAGGEKKKKKSLFLKKGRGRRVLKGGEENIPSEAREGPRPRIVDGEKRRNVQKNRGERRNLRKVKAQQGRNKKGAV